MGVLFNATLANKGSGSLNKDIEGEIGEFIVVGEEDKDDREELDDKEWLDELGDILMIDVPGTVVSFLVAS